MPICAIAAGQRIWAYLKCSRLSTWVHKLVSRPFRTWQWTWVTGVARWTLRQCPQHSPLSHAEWLQWESWDSHEAKANVELAISNREHNIRLTGYHARSEPAWYIVGDYSKSPM